MLKKFKVLIVIASLAITLSLMSNTYSRYVASSEGNVEIEFAKWQLLVNTVDVTSSSTSNISFEPVIETNVNIAKNKVAPSSTGYFDIEIDPTNVDVSFKYTIDLNIDSEKVPDLMITKYAVLPDNYIEGNALNFSNLVEGKISNVMNYSEDGFKKFTLRIYFQWFEGQTETMNETMDDVADTNVGYAAATENTTFAINANINFEQYLGE
jgi:hypothetical protein